MESVREVAQEFCAIARSVTDVVDSWELHDRQMLPISDVLLAVSPLRNFATGVAVVSRGAAASVIPGDFHLRLCKALGVKLSSSQDEILDRIKMLSNAP